MDFVSGLPWSQNQFVFIWVIVDRMMKSSHFFLVRTNFLIEHYARLYLYEIVKWHEVPISIISDHGTQFSLNFWWSF